MAKSATLAIRIVSDASGASKGFEEAESRVDKFSRGLDRVTPAAAATVAGIAAVAKTAYDAASRLEQSTGAIDSVFGDWALDIEQEAQKAAQGLGLSAAAYQESAALIGAQLKGMGYDNGQAVDGVKSLTAQAADLAATFGGSTTEALEAFSSALKGERDPIERYGMSLTQAAVDAKVAAMGLDTSTDASARNAQAQATLALLAEQGAIAQGAFAREANTAAGQTQRAQAEWENASAALGEVLLPIVTAAAVELSELARWMVENKDVVIPVVAVIGSLAAGILVLNGAMRAYSVVQGIVNAVLNASPLMRMVFIIGAIIAMVVALVNHFGGFKAVAEKVGNALKTAFDKARSAVAWVIDKVEWLLNKTPAGMIVGLFTSSGEADAAAARHAPGGGLAGVYGATAPGAGPGVYGAPMSALAGGRSTAGQGSTGTVDARTIITVNGALDPSAVADQITRILRDRDREQGRRVAVNLS